LLFLTLNFLSFILIFFVLKSVFIFFLINISEYFHLILEDFLIFDTILNKLTYNFYVWKIYFDISIFINLLLFLLILYMLFYNNRNWKFSISFYMLIPLLFASLYISLWPSFFDINFFNFISLDYLDKNIKIYHKLLLIYEMKGFNLVEFFYDETHFISKIIVFNTYFFYFLYFFLIILIFFDSKINSFFKSLYIILLSFFIKYSSFIIIELFYSFAIKPYKMLNEESMIFDLFNTMNYIQMLFFTF